MDSVKFARAFFSTIVIGALVGLTSTTSSGTMPSAAPPSGTAVAVLPNVLMIFDISGSMKNNVFMSWKYTSHAYDPNPDVKYNGVFDPDKRYRYTGTGANAYFEQVLLGAWSGKFLNWIAVTRLDVARYVLYGGQVVTESGYQYIVGNNKTKNTWDNDSSYPYTGPRMASYDDGTVPFLTPYGGLGTYSYHHRDVDPARDPFASVPAWSVFDVYNSTGTFVETYNIRLRLPAGAQPRGALHDLIDNARLGLMFFNGAEGGHVKRYVKKFDATELSLYISDVNSVLGYGQSHAWTPLAESLYEASRFFAQDTPYYFSSDYSPSLGNYPNDPMYNEEYGEPVWCAKNYVILLTDGGARYDTNIPGWLQDFDGDGCDSDPCPCQEPGCGYDSCDCSWRIFTHDEAAAYLDDVAYYVHHTDLRPGDLPNDQTITVHAVYMFGGEEFAETLLRKAAANGGGQYYLAEDAQTISTALRNIFEEITKEPASASSVAVTSEANSSAERIYIAYYKHPAQHRWEGSIRAFNLDEDGTILDSTGQPATEDDSGVLGNPLWDADVKVGEKAAADSRNIFAFVPPHGANPGTWSFDNTNRHKFMSCFDVDLDTDGIQDENGEAKALIDYIRGDDGASSGFTLRDRKGHYLGDIIHSSPIFSGLPTARYGVLYGDRSYWESYWTNQSRREVVFAGANDGMLHTFDAVTGEEIWAYVPYNLLPHLKWLADPNYDHCYSVDLESRVWEMKLNNAWRFILIGGMRIGGTPANVDTDDDGTPDTIFRSAYFAIDVTDPDNPTVMWEISDDRFGYTTSKPIAVKVGTGDQWYLVFGSGPRTRDGEGDTTSDGYSDTNAYVFVVDPLSGSIMRTFTLGVIRGVDNFMGSPVAVDYDFDYSVDLLYIGDAKGNLWRIKTYQESLGSKAYPADPSGWEIDLNINTPEPDPLLSLSPVNEDQPILMKPAVSLDDSGRVWVYVGTGRHLCGNDNACCDKGYKCPPMNPDGTCPVGNECAIAESGEAESKFMAVGVFDRYWDPGSDAFKMATNTIHLSDLDHRIITSGSAGYGGTGYAVVDESYPSQTIEIDVCDTCKGWYFHLLENTERCLGDFLINREMVYFLSYEPARDPNDPCAGGGISTLYGVYYKSGTSIVTPVFDLSGDGSLDENDQVSISGGEVGAAIKKLDKGFAGGALKAKGGLLYLPLGGTEEIPPPGSPFQTGVTSWKELSW